MHATIHTARLLALIEQLVDVNRHVVDRTHVWALFRTLMHFPLQRVFTPAHVPDALAERLREAFATRCTPRTVTLPDVTLPLFDAQADGPIVMIAAGPTHSRVVEGVHVSPIADAWTARFEADGHRVVKVDVLPEWLSQHQPRRYPSFAIAQPTASERQSVWPAVRTRWMPALEALFADINAALTPTVGFTLELDDSLTQAVARFVAERETAVHWLGALRPKAVCFVCYYETCYLPIVSACHARGVETVELQHGMNGSIHPAYSHWTALPEDGYDVLPSLFVTWGASSSRNLLRWWPAEQRGHRTLIAGRPSLERATAGSDDHADRLAQYVAGAECRVLITMQDKPLSARQLNEMRECPPEWLWLVRAHPNAARFPAGSAESVMRQLADASIANAMVVPPAMASLEALLRVVDVHVTHHSSCWLEAEEAGVPTVFTLTGADQLFEYELAEGLASYAPDGVGLRSVIETAMAAKAVAASRASSW
jgi:hypothetical protein